MTDGDKSMITYCGLYCGDCFRHKGEIADLARDLRKKLRENKFDKKAEALSKVFKELKDYDTSYQFLGTLVKQRCGRSCRDGGGFPCGPKLCCTKKGIEGCWECDDHETCSKLDFLKAVHGDGIVKNLRKLKKEGMEAFANGKRYT